MITFNSIYFGFGIKSPKSMRKWIKEVIISEKCFPGELQFIFCDDPYLLDINRKFLDHDYFTDVITFRSGVDDKIISGEVFISIDRIKENSRLHNQPFDRELSRIMVHAVLHLLGYSDTTNEDKMLMTGKEDYYLNLQAQKIS